MKNEVKSAALEILEDRIGGVNHDDVAAALARSIVDRDTFDAQPAYAVESGVESAIAEIDDAVFGSAVEAVQQAVDAEIASQAKAIALRMLRQLAATAEREEVATA